MAGEEPLYWATSWRLAWQSHPHRHSSGQLFSLDSGLAVMEAGQNIWVLMPGRIGWIPPGIPHSMRSFQQVSGWSLYLPDRFTRSFPKRPKMFVRSALLEQIIARFAEWQEARPAEGVRNRLLAVLSDEIKTCQEDPFHLRLPQDPGLRSLVELVIKDPGLNLSLDEWSRRIGMSKRSITRGFQEQTGQSLGKWLQQFRILAAMERLEKGGSVTEVALDCGYSSVSAFIRVFRLSAGVTPAQYRAKKQDRNRVLSQQRRLPVRMIEQS